MEQANFKQAVYFMNQVVKFSTVEETCHCKILWGGWGGKKSYLKMDGMECQACNSIFL